MKSLNNKLEQIIKPTRVNYINLYNAQKDHQNKFTEHHFQLRSFDGTTIECLYLENKENENNYGVGTIVYNHSHGSCKFEGSGLIKHCAEYGYDICLYDSRACGKSGDSSIHFGFKEYIDLLYILLKLTLVYNRRGFVLWGRSIGCNAVLQLYHALNINESINLNKNITTNKDSNIGPVKRAQTSNKPIRKEVKYPNDYNKLIDEHLDTFLMHNARKLYGSPDVIVNFTIQAIVLDSPYSSFTSFLKDNIAKLVGFMTPIISSPLSLYLKSFYNKKLGIDLETSQNINLLPKINLNTVFLISDMDEIIPYSSYTDMIAIYGSEFSSKNEPRVYNTKQSHGAFRIDSLISNCLLQIITSIKPSNTQDFMYNHKTRAELNKITDFKSFVMPKRDFNTVFERHETKHKEVDNNNDDGDAMNLGLRKVKSTLFGIQQPLKSTRLAVNNPYQSFRFISGKEDKFSKY